MSKYLLTDSRIIEEFRGLAWTEVKPNYLDYANAQILLIGHSNNSELGKAVEPTSKNQKNDDKETPLEEIEKLEHEDELRVQHLHGMECRHHTCF
jgi:uroporphyrinogen-III synthase